ncbi:MAG: hypothetical protein RIC52_05690 [Amphiplicatus sp.]
MTTFATLTSPAIPLFRDNLDTDIIAPVSHAGSGQAFARMRVDPAGRAIAGSLFERPLFSQAAILIVGREFGFGDRPGDAVLALKSLGLACVLGLSFAPTFAVRALDEGIVSLMLAEDAALQLAEEAMMGDAFTIDLASLSLITSHGYRYELTPPAATRARLLALCASDAGSPLQGYGASHLIYAARA